MLGTSVPEPNKQRDRIFVCSAGLDADAEQLVRIYPLGVRNPPKRWHVYSVPVDRNPHDSRPESWQLSGDRSVENHPNINSLFTPQGEWTDRVEQRKVLSQFLVTSIAEANNRKLSLAILQPNILDFRLQRNPSEEDTFTFDIFNGHPDPARERFPYIPRMRIAAPTKQGYNDLQIREWGVFELIRKNYHDKLQHMTNEDQMSYVLGGLHLTKPRSLLIGNMNNQRTVWLVISVLPITF